MYLYTFRSKRSCIGMFVWAVAGGIRIKNSATNVDNKKRLEILQMFKHIDTKL